MISVLGRLGILLPLIASGKVETIALFSLETAAWSFLQCSDDRNQSLGLQPGRVFGIVVGFRLVRGDLCVSCMKPSYRSLLGCLAYFVLQKKS